MCSRLFTCFRATAPLAHGQRRGSKNVKIREQCRRRKCGANSHLINMTLKIMYNFMRKRGRTTEHPLLAAYHHCSQLPWTKGPGKGCGGGAGCQGTVMNEKDTGLGIRSFRSNQIKANQIRSDRSFPLF